MKYRSITNITRIVLYPNFWATFSTLKFFRKLKITTEKCLKNVIIPSLTKVLVLKR